MARCYACDERISYRSFVFGTLKYFRRNMLRRTLPVFDCPSCGVECQERASTTYGFLVAFFVPAFLAVFGLGRALALAEIGGVTLAMGGLGLCFVAHYAWWHRISKLKLPHVFFWE